MSAFDVVRTEIDASESASSPNEAHAAMSSIEDYVRRLRASLELCAKSNHGKALELELSDRPFDECGDPTCRIARDLLEEAL